MPLLTKALGNMKLRSKLILGALLLSVLPVLVTGVLIGMQSVQAGKKEVQKEAEERLIAVRDMKKMEIERYFQRLNNQVLTFSNNGMVIHAMREFNQAFHAYRSDMSLTDAQIAQQRHALASYYTGDFTAAYKKMNQGESVQANALLNALDADGVALQYQWIQNNPNPLGSKDALLNLKNSSGYARVHSQFHEQMREFQQRFGFYDIFLVDIDSGDVVYSVFKELDFATSLNDGKYAHSGLGDAFRMVKSGKKNAVSMTDFKPYLPSYHAQAGFMASPIYDGEKRIGVLIFQMPIAAINDVMTSEKKWKSMGLGDSGESYLVGKDHTLRSESRFLMEDKKAYLAALKEAGAASDLIESIAAKNSAIGLQMVKSQGVQAAQDGKTGALITPDYRGVSVLSAFTPVSINGLDWVLMAELDEAEAFAGIDSMQHTIVLAVLLIVLLVVGVAIVLAIMGANALTRPINQAVDIAHKIAGGDFDSRIVASSKDEIGDLMRAFERMQGELFTRITAEKDAMERIKRALDKAGSNVMLADAAYNIFYFNEAMQAMLRRNEASLKKALPNLNLNTLMGSNMDIFHKDQSHQRRILDRLHAPYVSADMSIGDIWIRITATPVFNDKNERIATITEWEDRTAQIQTEREVEKFVATAVRGDFSERITLMGKEGFLLKLTESLNAMSDVVAGAFSDTTQALRALEEGDLTHRIHTSYEGVYDDIKQAANNSAEKLAETLSDVRHTAMNVADGSAEISRGNATLSDRTQEQAAALEETSASLEELTGTVQQNADNARQANQLALNTSEQAEKGRTVVGQAIDAMSGISQSSRKISDIIGVIDEIAFQTNLLALNAAVEAARAGEQGRGFAVVAGEVRTLAQRSAQAAKEIKDLIQASVGSVERGSKLVNDSGEALAEIVGSVQKVTDIIAEIAAASQEQSLGVEQINKAITQLDSAVQQNAALVEETASSSANLDHEAGEVLARVNAFNLGKDKARSSRERSEKYRHDNGLNRGEGVKDEK